MAGGARPGSGPKKGSHRIQVKELREALQRGLKVDYAEHLKDVYLKLFTDFQQDINVTDFLRFNENMNKRILADQVQEVHHSIEELSDSEIDDKLNNLITRQVLSTPKEDNDK